MAIAETAPAAMRLGNARNLDLKWSLTLRVVTVALACFLAAAALVVYGTYHELRHAQENVADAVVRLLQVQLFRIETNSDLPSRFPEWEPLTDRVQAAGQCVQYIKPDGTVGRSSCMGAEGRLPAWAAALGSWMVGTRADIARPIVYRTKTYGTLVVTTQPSVVLAAIWKDVSRLLYLTALVIGAICLLQYAAISRALRPTREILVGLDRLARGDLSCRLPDFGLIELQRISEVFNALAANLDRTMRERAALAARLVDGQEQERRHLARELHDELAQTLSAITAAAASIRATAETECPALVSEADKLSHTSMAMMRSLRTTLQTLRPPEIDDFGLAASLATLARDQERRAGGRLKVSLELDGDLRGLPPTAASHVYRIVQEGLTNVGKHANATRARVALGFRSPPPEQAMPPARWLALTIEDDGCGAVDRGAAAEGDGLGLIGMRERALALGGQLDVVQLDRGFRLQARIPFGEPAEVLQ